MILKVPNFMKDVTNQNIVVLSWFMLQLQRAYPDIRIRSKGNVTHAEFGFYPEDVRSILRHKGYGHNLLAKEPSIERNQLMIGEYSDNDTVVSMRIPGQKADYNITDQKCIELVCYLSGCLNRNLIEPDQKFVKYFKIDSAIKNNFRWAQHTNK